MSIGVVVFLIAANITHSISLLMGLVVRVNMYNSSQ
jgi:hypothetical protein